MKKLLSLILVISLAFPCFTALATETSAYDYSAAENIRKIVFPDVSFYEGGETENRLAFDEITGDYYEYEAYTYYPEAVTVYYKNGISKEQYIYNGELYLEEECFTVSLSDDQSPDNVWGVGKHTGAFEVLGFSQEITVTVKESPVERIEAKDISIIEGSRCETVEGTDENGNPVSYRVYIYDPEITVYFKDGHSEKSFWGIDLDGMPYYPRIHDDQAFDNVWGVGAHTVSVSLLGAQTELTVTITENPIETLEIEDISLYENFDGINLENTDEEGNVLFSYFYYNYMPDKVIVHFKDGKKVPVENGYIAYNGETYPIIIREITEDGEYSSEVWKKGETRRFTASVLGVETSYNVTVADNPYVALSVNEGNELSLTLTRDDGTKDILKAEALTNLGQFTGDGDLLCYVKTDSGKHLYLVLSCPGFEEQDFSQKLSVSVGKLNSNTVNGNAWVNTSVKSTGYGATIRFLKDRIKETLGYDFTGFDGTVTNENLDAIILIATYICGNMFEAETDYDGENYYVILSEEDVAMALNIVFGADGVNLKNSSLYNGGFLRIPEFYEYIPSSEQALTYKNSLFLLTYTESGFGSIHITLDDEVHIKAIAFKDEVQKGDINGDGKVNSIDSNLIKKVIMGTLEYTDVADINYDGKCNSVDSNLLKKIIMGVYKA